MMNNSLRSFLQVFKNHNQIHSEDLWRLFDECHRCRRCYKYLDRFLYECGGFEQNAFVSNDIHPHDLAMYVRNLVRNANHDSQPQACMQTLNIDFTDEISF